jgi:hypothetical protein
MTSLSEFAGHALLRPVPAEEAMGPSGPSLVPNCRHLVVVVRTFVRNLTDCVPFSDEGEVVFQEAIEQACDDDPDLRDMRPKRISIATRKKIRPSHPLAVGLRRAFKAARA